MIKIDNFNNVQPSTGEFERPKIGGYICRILNVEDVKLNTQTNKGNYLKISYDIADGEFKGYYTDICVKFKIDYPFVVKSYKEKALGMFKHFINCVEQSNLDYTWDWDENKLKGKYIGFVLGEEEYERNDGSIATRLYVNSIKTIHQIKSGDFKIPKLKEFAVPHNKNTEFIESDDDNLPFD